MQFCTFFVTAIFPTRGVIQCANVNKVHEAAGTWLTVGLFDTIHITLRQPITGQNGLLMADLWPAVTRQLRAAERPRELAIESIPSY